MLALFKTMAAEQFEFRRGRGPNARELIGDSGIIV